MTEEFITNEQMAALAATIQPGTKFKIVQTGKTFTVFIADAPSEPFNGSVTVRMRAHQDSTGKDWRGTLTVYARAGSIGTQLFKCQQVQINGAWDRRAKLKGDVQILGLDK